MADWDEILKLQQELEEVQQETVKARLSEERFILFLFVVVHFCLHFFPTFVSTYEPSFWIFICIYRLS